MVAWSSNKSASSMQYYFSLALSFLTNVGEQSLAETTFTIEASGLLSTVCNYFQFMQ